LRDLDRAHTDWANLNFGPAPALGYPDGHIPFKPGGQETTHEYQALCRSQAMAHHDQIAELNSDVVALRRSIEGEADALMDAAADQTIGVDYAKFRELVDGWPALPNPAAYAAAKSVLDLLRRRLQPLAEQEEMVERVGLISEADVAAGRIGNGSQRRGRPPVDAEEEQRRADILKAWAKAKAANVRQKQFCEDNDIDVATLEKYVNWQTKRDSRQGGA
jgi:hypothetical protein